MCECSRSLLSPPPPSCEPLCSSLSSFCSAQCVEREHCVCFCSARVVVKLPGDLIALLTPPSLQVTISGFDLTDYRQCMMKWNSAMSAMHLQCTQLGPSVCLPVYYEQLVLRPQEWLRKILQFLEVPWNDTVLHHELFINKPGGISLSK